MTDTLRSAVLFDGDHVLIDSGAIHTRVWEAWARLRGLDPDDVRRLAQGRRRLDTLRIVAPDCDVEAENRALDRLMAAEEVNTRPYLDAAEVLRTLTVPWAVVTASRQETTRVRMGRPGLHVPEVRICAEDVQQGKPFPEGYLAAAARLGVAARLGPWPGPVTYANADGCIKGARRVAQRFRAWVPNGHGC